MPAQTESVDDHVGAVPGFPGPTDLADVWLVHALAHLLNAYNVPDADRRALVTSPAAAATIAIPALHGVNEQTARLQRLDAARLALVSAALAVEARMNRVLRRGDPAEWEAIAHLVPAKKFRVAPRLLDAHESASKHEALCDLVEEIFRVRDELVDAAGQPGAALNVMSSRFSPSHARAMVEASAKICRFLATLGEEGDNATAELVRDVANGLQRRLDFRSEVTVPSPDWEWSTGDLDFPPDIIGS